VHVWINDEIVRLTLNHCDFDKRYTLLVQKEKIYASIKLSTKYI